MIFGVLGIILMHKRKIFPLKWWNCKKKPMNKILQHDHRQLFHNTKLLLDNKKKVSNGTSLQDKCIALQHINMHLAAPA